MRGQRGFTLLEMAVVLIIAGILLTAGVKLLNVRLSRAQIDATVSRQAAIKAALIAYLAQVKRLPCPDTAFNGREDRSTNGVNDPCTAYVGTVPYMDLGLDQAGVLDGWSNYIKYVVSIPNSNPAPPANTPPYTTRWLYTYTTSVTDATRQTPTGTNAFWPSTSVGGIVVRDVAGNATSNPASTPPSGAVAVLISHGANGAGAMNVTGTQNSNAGAGADELKNVTPLVATRQLEVVDREITDQLIPSHGAFDDILLVLRREDFVGPLTASGALKATADAALTQANDAVIGNILSSRGNAPGGGCTYQYSVPSSTSFSGLPAEWGVSYTRNYNSPIRCDTSTTSAAYTLTAGDGTTRSVSVTELMGILGRAGGFN